MKELSVKAYAALIGKSEKTVYKMIKKDGIDAFKKDKTYRIRVDRNLLKVIDRTQRALEEAKTVLASIEASGAREPLAETVAPKTAKKAPPKKHPTRAVNAPKKKTVKKSVSGSLPKKRTTKKR